ncbi:hypothetical protein FVE85_7352 [Porphyridium purpureum]|uniref:VOC domain-containing protein n=1 Tax=Porphyridium purpureum TaxID=35688 RepID=A0A5J4ZAV7_PORPP|nr:hypothetical protein FVE85_7352 [Porphyridium purpureum]|eukprot:POR3711..scf295_1
MSGLISHVSVGCQPADMVRMVEMYDAIMTKVGAKRQMVITQKGNSVADVHASVSSYAPDDPVVAIAYGKYYPELWVQLPHDEKPASSGNGAHVAFACKSKEMVDQVHATAIAAGATCNGPPGPRPQYSDKYYGAFFTDPAGNKLEAIYYDLGLLGYCTIA